MGTPASPDGQKIWQEFDPSTFTFLARNDMAFDWVLRYRDRNDFPIPQTVYLLGSGAIEPFTIAALPGMENSQVIAVDINADLISLGEDIKNGATLTWKDLADKAKNPGVENNDLLAQDRLTKSFEILRDLGSLNLLGSRFNINEIAVSQEVRNRVDFVHKDALSFLAEAPQVDLIGDFFLQVNINKHPDGEEYTRQMLRKELNLLDVGGMLLIGDTGRNIPTTMRHFAGRNLNLSSMVHGVNFGKGYITSHYLLASGMKGMPDEKEISIAMAERIATNATLKKFSPEHHDGIDLSDVSKKSETHVNLGYVERSDYFPQRNGEAWFSSDEQTKVFPKVVPQPKDEISEEVLFPAQKPYLSKRD